MGYAFATSLFAVIFLVCYQIFILLPEASQSEETGLSISWDTTRRTAFEIRRGTTLSESTAMSAPTEDVSAAEELYVPNPSGKCVLRQLNWSSNLRSERFPSVEERICLYMSVWYDAKWNTSQPF
jgi:hypothetical protein